LIQLETLGGHLKGEIHDKDKFMIDVEVRISMEPKGHSTGFVSKPRWI